MILPGLVNAHTHLEYAAMGGFGDGMTFGPWIEDHIRRKAATGPDDSLEQARAGAAACLRSGVTTIADCSYSGAVAAAAAEAGLRAIVYLEGFSDWADLRARTEARIDAMTTTALVQPGVSPHAPFTVTLDDYRMLVGLARERGLPVATHLLESSRETLHLDAFRDVLGPDTVAIHLVFADPADIELMAELDVPAVHCPRSNALLGCGIAPLPELLEAGVRVGLGTDSPSSAIDFDMWAEMRAAVMHARARLGRADALSARSALELATTGGAAALGLGDATGTLTPGKAADVCVLDLSGSSFLPVGRPDHGGRVRRLMRPGLTDDGGRRDTLPTRIPRVSDGDRRQSQDDPRLRDPCSSNAYAAGRNRSSSSWQSCSGWGSSRWAWARAREASTSATS